MKLSAKAAVIGVGCAAVAIVAAPVISLLTSVASESETRASVAACNNAGEFAAAWMPVHRVDDAALTQSGQSAGTPRVA
jgi:hypothetical protein